MASTETLKHEGGINADNLTMIIGFISCDKKALLVAQSRKMSPLSCVQFSPQQAEIWHGSRTRGLK